LQLAALLNSHKKVTIYCGLGAAEAHTEIIQLAEKLKAPVAYSYKAKMAIQYDNPYEVGLTGLLEFHRLIIVCMNVNYLYY